MKKADIGMVGMAVMGSNLALNMESHGFTVAIANREVEDIDKFMNGRGKGKNFIPCYSYEQLVENLKSPKKVFLMIRAGRPVDEMIETLLPLLDKGDTIIDGGNSEYTDTIRRSKYVESKGLYYIGTGVSGGEEGALKGPSMMPGGSVEGYKQVQPIFEAICAKADSEPCCKYVGSDGAGHYVKMVHNGIEYGDMQLICEIYSVLQRTLGLNSEELGDVFAKFNEGKLNSYLIEITSKILKYKENGEVVVEKILDKAGQKGTGKWAVISSLNEGIPLTLISEAVSARSLSALKNEREIVSKFYPQSGKKAFYDKEDTVLKASNALYAAKIISYAQGFTLLASAGRTYGWQLNYGDIALMWRGGCIIRSVFLGKIKEAFDKNPALSNLLLDDFFREQVSSGIESLREIIKLAIDNCIPTPSLSAALSYFDGLRSARLPANLLQAQRDYFGAHTYERIDKPSGVTFHTNWTGEGGDATSGSYNA